MNEIVSIMNYTQLKGELNEELSRTANSFVRIGYLLKIARDNKDILEGSGYSDVNEFASKEFGLDKTQVSRFIRINDRFSIDGNSTQLLPEYAEYGSAKLSIMLTLPDEINQELSPEYSKSDIQAIKEDYEAEQKITPIEVACEEKDPDAPDDFIACVVKQLNDEHPDPINFFHETTEIGKKIGQDPDEEDVKEAYIPDGDHTYNIRIPGQGRFMVNMKQDGVTIVNMRDPSIKTPLHWDEFTRFIIEDEETRDFTEKQPEKKEKPKKVEKSKVAPEQPKKEKKGTESVKKETENEQKDPENDNKCSNNEKNDQNPDEIEQEEVMNPPEEAASEEPEEAAGAKYEDTDVLDKIQVDLIDELEIIKTYIERRNWRSARETIEDVLNRVKHLGF